LVNWFEIVVTRSDGKVLYKNAFATNPEVLNVEKSPRKSSIIDSIKS
jgi:hypothetical protein